MREAEKIYNKRETPEEREERLRKSGKKERPGDNRRPRVDRDQCAYCKERGHWVKDCPKRPQDPRKTSTRVLSLDED